MDTGRSPQSPYDSIYAVLSPAAAPSVNKQSSNEPLIPADSPATQSNDAKALDNLKLEFAAGVKSLEYLVSSFQIDRLVELKKENQELLVKVASITKEKNGWQTHVTELEEDLRRVATLDEEHAIERQALQEKMLSVTEELDKVRIVQPEVQKKQNVAQGFFSGLLSSVLPEQPVGTVEVAREAQIKALKVEKKKLRSDRNRLAAELQDHQRTIQEHEDELRALRLQHDNDVRAKEELLEQMEEVKELASSKSQRTALQGHGQSRQRSTTQKLENKIEEQENALVKASEAEERLHAELRAERQHNQ